MKIYEEWIRKRLPDDLPEEIVKSGLNFCGLYTKGLQGLKVMAFGERGLPDRPVYEAADQDDMRFWQFDAVCSRIGFALELIRRRDNEKKWRYIRDRAENGRWLYIERRNYLYNAIEDSRLDAFEIYLRLLRSGLPAPRWEESVKKHTALMNRWYKTPHWDYDKNSLCFIEISNSKEYAGDRDETEEPRPNSIVKVID